MGLARDAWDLPRGRAVAFRRIRGLCRRRVPISANRSPDRLIKPAFRAQQLSTSAKDAFGDDSTAKKSSPHGRDLPRVSRVLSLWPQYFSTVLMFRMPMCFSLRAQLGKITTRTRSRPCTSTAILVRYRDVRGCCRRVCLVRIRVSPLHCRYGSSAGCDTRAITLRAFRGLRVGCGGSVGSLRLLV
jgi:hypothetical protein